MDITYFLKNISKKFFKKIGYISAIVIIPSLLSSCTQREAPTIYFSNASPYPIKDIECIWNNKYSLTLSNLNPGDSRSQSFYITRYSQFFGPVNISWYNKNGQKIVKNFNFKKENLPSISDHEIFNYVQLYFGQDDLESVSSDSPDVANKGRRMDRIMKVYHDQFEKNQFHEVIVQSCSDPFTGCIDSGSNSLIKIQEAENY